MQALHRNCDANSKSSEILTNGDGDSNSNNNNNSSSTRRRISQVDHGDDEKWGSAILVMVWLVVAS